MDSGRWQDDQPTTATSPNIFPVGVIQHAATLKWYEARARVRVATQEPNYTPAFHYRVVLRTIVSLDGKEGWLAAGYLDKVWTADYAPTATDPTCQRLVTNFVSGAVLSEVVLYEGSSPPQPATAGGQATLQAATFDWYVPLRTRWRQLAMTASGIVRPDLAR